MHLRCQRGGHRRRLSFTRFATFSQTSIRVTRVSLGFSLPLPAFPTLVFLRSEFNPRCRCRFQCLTCKELFNVSHCTTWVGGHLISRHRRISPSIDLSPPVSCKIQMPPFTVALKPLPQYVHHVYFVFSVAPCRTSSSRLRGFASRRALTARNSCIVTTPLSWIRWRGAGVTRVSATAMHVPCPAAFVKACLFDITFGPEPFSTGTCARCSVDKAISFPACCVGRK